MFKMLKTKLSIAIALVAALSLLLTPIAYADVGTTQGSFGAASKAPTVESIEIYNIDNTVANSMTPLVTYYAKVIISSASKLKNLDTVKVTLFYNSLGDNTTTPGPANTQTCAILSRTVGGTLSDWTINAGGGTTWQIVGGSCIEPTNLNDNSGEWRFYFIPGKVAHVANGAPSFWDAQGLATNKFSQSDQKYVRGKYMNCYTEIAVTGGVNWGNVPLGLTFEDLTNNPRPASDNITINYIANGNYESDIKSTDWTSSETVTLSTGDPPGGAGQFALKAYSSDNLTAAVVVTSGYTAMDATGTITLDAGTPFIHNRLWLSLSGTGILPGVYSGTIWYKISCR
jgi:hypothetical protein